MRATVKSLHSPHACAQGDCPVSAVVLAAPKASRTVARAYDGGLHALHTSLLIACSSSVCFSKQVYVCANGLHMCRFDVALHGWCSAECEDLLQHLLTVHLGSRDAANDMNLADVLPAMQSAAGNDHLSAAAFMHQRFATLFEQYSSARGTLHGQTPWFADALPHQ